MGANKFDRMCAETDETGIRATFAWQLNLGPLINLLVQGVGSDFIPEQTIFLV